MTEYYTDYTNSHPLKVAGTDTILKATDGLGVNARSSGTWDEVTADAIASWGLNDFEGSLGAQQAGRVAQFMDALIRR